MFSFHDLELVAINAFSHFSLLYSIFKVRKKFQERHFYEIITSRSGSKLGQCVVNNMTNIVVVLDLIMLHTSGNLLKTNDCFGTDFSGNAF